MQIYTNNYLVLMGFVSIAGTFTSILFFPLNYYTEFILEHKFNLSNQTFLVGFGKILKLL